LALSCEVCGNPVGAQPARVEIDGAVLLVCPSCAKRGTPIRYTQTTSSGFRRRMPRPVAGPGAGPELEVDPDYASIVKAAREKLGVTQEQLGRAANVKPSVISHVETGKMKPDIALARTLMHHLKVNLLVSSEELDSQS
jgi:putative transcription factor